MGEKIIPPAAGSESEPTQKAWNKFIKEVEEKLGSGKLNLVDLSRTEATKVEGKIPNYKPLVNCISWASKDLPGCRIEQYLRGIIVTDKYALTEEETDTTSEYFGIIDVHSLATTGQHTEATVLVRLLKDDPYRRAEIIAFIKPGQPITVGRENFHQQLGDNLRVSRKHFTIQEAVDGTIIVEDTSANGTKVITRNTEGLGPDGIKYPEPVFRDLHLFPKSQKVRKALLDRVIINLFAQ